MRKVLFLLSHLTDSDLEWLVASGRKVLLPPRSVLIRQGQHSDSLYVLLQGELEVTGAQFKGPPIVLRSGEVVGEVSLLDSRPPTATVTSLDTAIVLAIPRDKLMVKLSGDSDFGSRFYRSLAIFLAHRLRNTYQNLSFGKSQPLDEDAEYDDELSPEVLDSVHLAATKFDRVLQRLLAS